MEKFIEIFQDLVIKALQQVYQFTMQVGPKIILSIIILSIGWVSALLIKKIVSKILKAVGLDVLSEKTGIKRFLERGGVQKNPSYLAGVCLYWIIIFSALIMVFNALELEIASRLIKQTLVYIPKIIVALVIATLGIFLSKFVSSFVQASAHLANIVIYGFLGKVAQFVVVGLTIMLILEYLGAETSFIVQYVVIIFGVIPLIISLIFLIGGRDIVSSMLAGRFLQKAYKKGDIVEFDTVSGKIQSIDLITTKIKSDSAEISIPNSALINKIIKRHPADTET